MLLAPAFHPIVQLFAFSFLCVWMCVCVLFLVFTVAAGYTWYEFHICREYKCWFCETFASCNNNTLWMWIKQKYKSETTTQKEKKEWNRMKHMASERKYQRLFRINMNIMRRTCTTKWITPTAIIQWSNFHLFIGVLFCSLLIFIFFFKWKILRAYSVLITLKWRYSPKTWQVVKW